MTKFKCDCGAGDKFKCDCPPEASTGVDITARAMVKAVDDPKKKGYYVLFIWGDIEPEVWGPYSTEERRDEKARALRKEHGEDHGIYGIDCASRPEVWSYSGGFFNDNEEEGA